MKEKSRRFYYGWTIVALSFLCLSVSLGVRYCFGIFYVAILKEYGWSRAETAGAFSLAMLIHAVFAPLTGMLIDRFSPRIIFPLGATFLALGLAAASRITAIWHLYLFFGVIIAIGINTHSLTPHITVISKWFIRKRGLANGLALAGFGLGTMVLTPLVQLIIDIADWRFAFLALAAIVFGILVPITAIFERRSPEEVGQYPDGIAIGANKTLSPLTEGFREIDSSLDRPQQWTFKAALCTRAFWMIALMFFSVSFTVNMMLVHQAAYMVDAGFSPIVVASLVGLVGLFSSVGGVLIGFLSDRFGRVIAYFMGAGTAFAGLTLLLLVGYSKSMWILYGFVILYGLGQGSMGPIPTTTVGDLFSGNMHGRIFGALTIAYGIGGALGPFIGGYFFDLTGNYTLPFLMALASIVAGGVVIRHAVAHRRSERRFLRAGTGASEDNSARN
ncbi:MAG: MFS transporter [Desulfobacterales bacterium]|nr:MFS transporter [Desulfobacterales bacterium]